MDEWITVDRIEKYPSEGNRLEKEKKKADEINQILNESSNAAILEYRDPPSRKRQRSDSSDAGSVSGKGKENTVFNSLSSSSQEESSLRLSNGNLLILPFFFVYLLFNNV